MRHCDFCTNFLTVPFHKCKCGQVRYCSVACFNTAMKIHKKVCPGKLLIHCFVCNDYKLNIMNYDIFLAYLIKKVASRKAFTPPVYIPPSTSQAPQTILPSLDSGPACAGHEHEAGSSQQTPVAPVPPPSRPANMSENPEVQNTTTLSLPPDHIADAISPDPETQSARVGITSRKRDCHGQFIGSTGVGEAQEKTEEQKARDQISSRVTKIKRSIIERILEIQKLR